MIWDRESKDCVAGSGNSVETSAIACLEKIESRNSVHPSTVLQLLEEVSL